MNLSKLTLRNFRSVRDASVELDNLALLIGANASGKSNVLDALRFLSEGIQFGDFRTPAFSRGGILNLAWKGQEAQRIELAAIFNDQGRHYEWAVSLNRQGYEFYATERVRDVTPGTPPQELLSADSGKGWWWSDNEAKGVTVSQQPASCAFATASADVSFPARDVAQFVRNWGFFDPSPFLLRRDWNGIETGRLDPYGRNLGETLYSIQETSPKTFELIVSATRSVLGVPSSLQARESEDRFYFVQEEPGLRFPVNQMGVSSGTLRMLALMTALYSQTKTTLLGIEEPENYVHPSALHAFVEHIKGAEEHAQIMITTHSPLLLDIVNDPASIFVVRRDLSDGTIVAKEKNPEGVIRALEASGFGLGEYYEARGFGG